MILGTSDTSEVPTKGKHRKKSVVLPGKKKIITFYLIINRYSIRYSLYKIKYRYDTLPYNYSKHRHRHTYILRRYNNN